MKYIIQTDTENLRQRKSQAQGLQKVKRVSSAMWPPVKLFVSELGLLGFVPRRGVAGYRNRRSSPVFDIDASVDLHKRYALFSNMIRGLLLRTGPLPTGKSGLQPPKLLPRVQKGPRTVELLGPAGPVNWVDPIMLGNGERSAPVFAGVGMGGS